VASTNEKTSIMVQMGLESKYFKVYTQKDVIGVELAGVFNLNMVRL
jgi:glycerol-3-phosphate dehydrogenase